MNAMNVVDSRMVEADETLHPVIWTGASLRAPANNCASYVRSAGTADVAVSLPAIVKAAGVIITVFLMWTGGSSVEVNIESSDDGFTTINLDADIEYSVLYCDGLRWHELASNHA